MLLPRRGEIPYGGRPNVEIVALQRGQPGGRKQISEGEHDCVPAALLQVLRRVGVSAGVGQVGGVNINAVFSPTVGDGGHLLPHLFGLTK